MPFAAVLLHPMALSPLSFSLQSPFVLNSSPSHLFPRFRSEKLRPPSPSPLLPSRPIISRHSVSVEPEAASDLVVAQDAKYGNKQVISLTPQLYQYVLANVREPPVLRELREETAGMRGSQMQILGAVKCIEIGVYTGYSSLAIALALPDSGHLVACERDANCLEIAKKYYERAGVSHKVAVKHALAVDTLEHLIQDGESCSYDLAFVDAEKRMYDEYYELLLQLVRVGGLIIFDNVLWHGKVSDPRVKDKKTLSLRNFNKKILEDDRVSISMMVYVRMANSSVRLQANLLGDGDEEQNFRCGSQGKSSDVVHQAKNSMHSVCTAGALSLEILGRLGV